jgi:hypothetical protein
LRQVVRMHPAGKGRVPYFKPSAKSSVAGRRPIAVRTLRARAIALRWPAIGLPLRTIPLRTVAARWGRVALLCVALRLISRGWAGVAGRRIAGRGPVAGRRPVIAAGTVITGRRRGWAIIARRWAIGTRRWRIAKGCSSNGEGRCGDDRSRAHNSPKHAAYEPAAAAVTVAVMAMPAGLRRGERRNDQSGRDETANDKS